MWTATRHELLDAKRFGCFAYASFASILETLCNVVEQCALYKVKQIWQHSHPVIAWALVLEGGLAAFQVVLKGKLALQMSLIESQCDCCSSMLSFSTEWLICLLMAASIIPKDYWIWSISLWIEPQMQSIQFLSRWISIIWLLETSLCTAYRGQWFGQSGQSDL